FQLDQGITRIFRIIEANENDPSRPVKLLEITPMTAEVGIQPVGFRADPSRRVFHSSTVVEITPGEFDRLQHGELQLPQGWELGEELLPHASATGDRA
ncbi:MAG TPA: hypothetical protein VMD30_02815, partial [Tepidisphaeraceae bacterium]|nr:hypothetical protein [Tepidisphaeraceae bacterium]